MHTLSRRRFLQLGLATTASLSPFLNLFGAPTAAWGGDTSTGYRAIVCVLLEGGADVFNMIVPSDQESYQDYQQVRGNLALARETLLTFSHANGNGLNPRSYGMRANMTRMHQLFEAGKLAIVANVGTLVQPVTAAEVANGAPVPFELFAHNTQRAQWMFGNATGRVREGWAGRASFAFYPPDHPAAPYFNVNVAETGNIMQTGGSAEAIQFAEAAIPGDTMTSYGFGPQCGGGSLGRVYQALYETRQTDTNKLMAALARKRVAELNRPLELADLFDGVREFDNFSSGVHEMGKPLGDQLHLVAQILSVKDRFPGQPARQIFFVNHHGWDTHDSDNEYQVGYLSDSLGAFQDAIDSLGLTDQVVTFTVSDFGRSLTTNPKGSDHGWGSHAFVMGGPVRGGDIFGKMPELRRDSPDSWSGRIVPTTAMEQYLATLVRWLGASEEDLQTIFPSHALFDAAGMGFLGGEGSSHAQVPWDLPGFRAVLTQSLLQYQSSADGQYQVTEQFAGFATDYFYLSDADTLVMETRASGNRRVELRQTREWDIWSEVNMQANLRCHQPKYIQEYTWMQIFGKDRGKPLLRLLWRRERAGLSNHLWAFLKTGDGELKTDLGTNPDGFFQVEVNVASGMVSVTIDGVTMLEEDVSFWESDNYLKAGLYLSGSANDPVPEGRKKARVEFAALTF